MNNLSLRSKFLLAAVTLLSLALGVFGYLSYRSYQQDKASIVFESLVSETIASGHIFNSIIKQQHTLLQFVVPQLDWQAGKISDLLTDQLIKSHRIVAIVGQIKNDQVDQKHVFYQRGKYKNLNVSPEGLRWHESSEIFSYSLGQKNTGLRMTLYFKSKELKRLIAPIEGRLQFALSNRTLLRSGQTTISDESVSIARALIHFRSAGLVERTIDGSDYLMAYTPLELEGWHYYMLVPREQIWRAEKIFVLQLVSTMLLILGSALFLALWAASRLTRRLRRLTAAAEEIQNGELEISIVDESRDEVGTLARSFMVMVEKVGHLLADLKKYNEELENRIAERTKDLSHLNNLQNVMLNSLGQGLVLIKSDLKASVVHTRISDEIFGVPINDAELHDILGVDKSAGHAELLEMAFTGQVSFQDVADIFPDTKELTSRVTSISYAAIQNPQSGELEALMLVGTDKTNEIISEKKFREEQAYSKLITQGMKYLEIFRPMVLEALAFFQEQVTKIDADRFEKNIALGKVHTYKGMFSSFHIFTVANRLHELESLLATPQNDERSKLAMQELLIVLECFVEHYEPIFRFHQSITHRHIPKIAIQTYRKSLEARRLPQELLASFDQSFQAEQIGVHVDYLRELTQKVAGQLGKEASLSITGGHFMLPDWMVRDVTAPLVHFIRNSLDHGIETSSERVIKHKNPTGQISFDFLIIEGTLRVVLQDDGKGIDWVSLQKKCPSMNREEILDRLLKGGLSSKSEVSDISGRGVGLSAIVEMVKQFNGALFVPDVEIGFKLVFEIPLEQNKRIAA